MAVQAENMADDVDILPEMRHWSRQEVEQYFESGGEERPDMTMVEEHVSVPRASGGLPLSGWLLWPSDVSEDFCDQITLKPAFGIVFNPANPAERLGVRLLLRPTQNKPRHHRAPALMLSLCPARRLTTWTRRCRWLWWPLARLPGCPSFVTTTLTSVVRVVVANTRNSMVGQTAPCTHMQRTSARTQPASCRTGAHVLQCAV